MDLAETVDDLICIFDGSGDTTMDTLAMFVFGWLLAALFVLWLGKLIYNRFLVKAIDKTIDVAAPPPPTPTPATPVIVDAVDSKKAVSGVVGGSAPPGARPGSRATGTTPTLRRRLTRQSPAPEPKKTKYVPAPTTSGSDNVSVLWVNDVFQWLYNDNVTVMELLIHWLKSLNEYCKKSMAEEGIGIEFVRILPESNPPLITNVFTECASNDDVTITCDCESTPAFQIKCFRQKSDKTEISHYRANLNRFRARLNIFAVSEKLQVYVKCDGWPEIKLALAPVGNIKNNLDETHLQEVITEIATNALRNMEVHLNLANYSSCPRLVRHVDSGIPGRGFFNAHANAYTSTPNKSSSSHENKRLLVKVVKAAQLGSTEGCIEPFCVLELDDPPQKQQTAIQKTTDSPVWDEQFLFDITPRSAEILFELYDHAKSPHKFLGLGIVGVEELLLNPAQRQIISLQSRPYESDQVSGTLTVEFSFIEGPEIPILPVQQPSKIRDSLLANITAANTIRNENLMNGHHLLGSPLQDPKERGETLSSTVVIHSVQRQASQRLVKVELNDGSWTEVERVDLDVSHENNQSNDSEKSAHESTNGKINNGDNNIANGASSPDVEIEEPPGMDNSVSKTNTLESNAVPENRGRTRKRRDFFGTIKRRLGRSKNRSKSAGLDENGRDDSLNRSISADRSRGDDSYLRANSARNDMETSRRSSISEASGLSSASTRTYLNEASTLVLETIENGIKKHYLVPLSLAQKSKWRKKGNKLHIFNDHSFIAKHLSGGTVCQVCSKSIARRLGKQGYECRDCLLKCHKHCHVKVNDNCPNSTIHNLELTYIQNPYTDKNIRVL